MPRPHQTNLYLGYALPVESNRLPFRPQRHAIRIASLRHRTTPVQLPHLEITMTPSDPQTLTRWGKIRYGLAAMLLGLPLPVVIIAFLWGGCSSN